MITIVCSLNARDVAAMNRYRSRYMNLAVYILAAVFITVGLVFVFKNRNYAQGWTLFGLGVFFPLFQYAMSFFGMKKMLKASPFICNQMRQTFTFNAKKVEVAQLCPGFDTRKSYAYDSMLKACETGNYIYLFLNKSQVLSINKKGEFTEGDLGALRIFLKERFKDSFKGRK